MKLELEDVIVILAPHNSFDETEWVRNDRESRKSKLAEVDKTEDISLNSEAQQEEAARDGKKQRQPFFNFDQFIANVVDNAQLTIKNVHIRIEDWWMGQSVTSYSLGSWYGLQPQRLSDGPSPTLPGALYAAAQVRRIERVALRLWHHSLPPAFARHRRLRAGARQGGART